MQRRNILLTGATVLASATALAVTPAALAGGTLPSVTVRVEGKARTLLLPTKIKPNGKTVTKGGHSCSGASGAGAFNQAVRGRWSGSYSTSFNDFLVAKILGEKADYTKTHTYWELFVNNVVASTGICGIKLHRGEQILFADVPATGTEYPLAVRPLGRATAGRPYKVKVVAYDAKGRTRPLPGAGISIGAGAAYPVARVKTNAHGIATLTSTHRGRVELTASKKGYIRDETAVDVK
jgi:hypothetical protein